MPITRKALQDLVNTYGGGNYDNIDMIVTTNSDVIRMDWYKVEGRGVQWVDKDLGDGEYRTGVELYGPIAHSAESSLEENGAKVIMFIDVEMIDRISFKAPNPPNWAFKVPSKNAYLKTLKVNNQYVIGFTKSILTYEVVLPYGTSEVPVVTATADDSNATVEITQAQSVTGTAEIKVTAEDETTENVYSIKFKVAPSNIAYLSSISVNGTPVSGFNKNTYNYNVELPNGTTQAPVVTVTTEDPEATFDITQAISPNGNAKIIVTAKDGETKKVYHINFSVQAANVNLQSININGEPLEGFNKNILNYNVVLPYGTTEAPEVTAIAEDESVTVDITQAEDPDAQATIVVTSQDGETTKTYTIQFSVEAPSTNAYLSSISLDGTPIDNFDKEVFEYNIELPQGTTELPEVTATAEDDNATININDEQENVIEITVTAQDGITTNIYTIIFTILEE